MTLYHGDCVEIIKTMADDSVDCVITDPPYPEIERDYGRMTESAWMDMMTSLVPEIRRVLRPSGSAVFVLQPNYQTFGRMRLWVYEFALWIGREWGIVQDAYWMNINAMPTMGSSIHGLMRPCLKFCVWAGDPSCYRRQEEVLWAESDLNKIRRMDARATGDREYSPSKQTKIGKNIYGAAERRGGVTPLNVFPAGNGGGGASRSGAHGHGAGTPSQLADFWIRYICPPNGVVFDPFAGVGTIPLQAIENGRDFVGIEKMEKYYEIAKKRIDESLATPRTIRMEI
jgi:DNA modification methylase